MPPEPAVPGGRWARWQEYAHALLLTNEASFVNLRQGAGNRPKRRLLLGTSQRLFRLLIKEPGADNLFPKGGGRTLQIFARA